MSQIRNFVFIRHLRSDSNAHVLLHRGGELRRSGRGLSFWFLPLTASLAEVPVDDRELALHVVGRSADFQDVTVQGAVVFQVIAPEKLSKRVDFTIDLNSGRHTRQPLEKLSSILTQRVQQLTQGYITSNSIRTILTEGPATLGELVTGGLAQDASLSTMGIRVVSSSIVAVKPTSDLERALEAPIREGIQQEADEAAFSRRAMAVEKERAIQENELQNQIELARREEDLIGQRGQNTRRQATEEIEAQRMHVEATAHDGRIEAEADAARIRIRAEADAEKAAVTGAAKAENVRLIEGARAEAEVTRMLAYKDIPAAVMFALAAQQLATKLERIDHLNLSPDVIGTALTDLLQAGSQRLSGTASS